ncbi:hypothetical protein [Psychrobium sp. 1_MG-2023]|uniref:hypothetical protein n=1 Tax=Psychrobium sp. 1_MG-2023 TaxID=3062624 RepID=UPI000C33DC71|nr:hypothetical protein [Psychrobium sp. 1_MG-2023]MDP2561759.1 hypothetical protein [Psychrobium sp. 1_MG-2023]PKF59792.1 hypothetical protein CW748_00715 [Alteromonadales bacterium alter-6D02]
MKHLTKFHKAPIRVIKINRTRAKINLRRTMVVLKVALAQEKDETKEMLAIYGKATQGKASKQEMSIAHAQFFDVLKGIGLGVFAVLPFAPITIPLLVKVADLVGVDLLPSSFSTKNDSDETK